MAAICHVMMAHDNHTKPNNIEPSATPWKHIEAQPVPRSAVLILTKAVTHMVSSFGRNRAFFIKE